MVKTHHNAPSTDPSRCYAQLPRSLRRSSYPLSTNFAHQLKINTASDPDTRSTTSALLQLTTDIETGFNQRKLPHRTVCVAIDLTASFDTVSHDTLISKIAGSSLPPAILDGCPATREGDKKSTVTLFTPDNTSSRCIRLLLLKTHTYRRNAVLKYWEGLWIHPYPSTCTATMCQIGSTREIIC